MKRKVSLLLFAVICAIAAPLSAQTVYYVDPDGADSDGLSWPAAFKTVKQAVDAVGTGGTATIYLKENAVFTQTNTTSNSSRIDFPANSTIEIIGNNTTVRPFTSKQATSSYRLFRIATGSVKLSGLIIENGFLNGAPGGVIYFAGEKLEIDNCIFSNNATAGSSAGGGAICSRGQELIVKNSYFKDNQANGPGGAILQAKTSGSLVVENCTFDNTVITATNSDHNASVIDFYESSTNSGATDIKIINNTFFNNMPSVGGTGTIGNITLNSNMGAATAYVINNTFLFNTRFPETGSEPDAGAKGKTIYRRNCAVRLEGTAHTLHFINNVVSGLRNAVAVSSASHNLTAKNNYSVVLESRTDVPELELSTTPDANGNITIAQTTSFGGDPTPTNITTLDNAMPQTGLATVLSTDKAIPYLPVDAGSPLIDTGLSSYANLPAADALGTTRASVSANTGSGFDIGAFEYITPISTGLITPSAAAPQVYASKGVIYVVPATDSPVTSVAVYSIQGTLVAGSAVDAAVYQSPVLPAGLYLVKITTGKGIQSVKLYAGL